ncbi:uncharacterized protein LOC105693631 [Athalia rosae]|uniref:uncharacterized protein LOC105693631 n=1 Tax=Athalia rosae TaxID=37344 RepID=UPI002033679B|nr:uncharacterized protein LOC105693631 [Athalia rosae]
MRLPLQLQVFGLLACLAFASASPGLFPRNKIVVYKYYADTKAGNIEPAPFASQFVITGLMHVTPELRDPTLKNAFHINLNVTHGMRNGEIQHFEKIEGNTLPIPEAAKALTDPFVAFYDDNGKVKGIIVHKDEPGWSRNMKQSIASMMQLDLLSMNLEWPLKPHAFLTKENTIYGECLVAYNVQREESLGNKFFKVTKNMEPMKCNKFDQQTFDSQEADTCLVEEEDDMTTASRRIVEIEHLGEDLLMHKISAHAVINYFPWRAQSEAHYILANQSILFSSMEPLDSITIPRLDMKESVRVDDVTYQKSQAHYAPHAGVDLTHGRHVVNLEVLTAKLIKMLGEAADYVKENHLDMTSPEMKHGQTINRILQAMTFMDLPSLEHIFNTISEGTSPREVRIVNFFLHTMPFVGTNATSLFIRNTIRKNKIETNLATLMLFRLPYNVRILSQELLIEMEPLMNLGNDVSPHIRKAGILCFATLIYKTQGTDESQGKIQSELLKKYIKLYFDGMMSEPSYEMKLVYLEALKNIQVGGVHKLLEPIIRGDIKVSEKPDHLRIHAMMVTFKASHDPEYIHNLFWPILSNTKLDLELRVTAYNILVRQPPRLDRLMNLYWFMVYEPNEHLYNFHYTMMKSMANSKNSCMGPMRDMARKILRFIRVRPQGAELLTGSWTVDYENNKFGFGDSISYMTTANQVTGMPSIMSIDYTSLNKRKPVNHATLWLRMEGMDKLLNQFVKLDPKAIPESHEISVESVIKLLKKASEDMPRVQPVHFELTVMIQGRTVMTAYFDEKTLPDLMESTKAFITLKEAASLAWQDVEFDELYSKQVPTDLGLTSMLYNKIPSVRTINGNRMTPQPPQSGLYGITLEMNARLWRHGYHLMGAYNPIVDTWHSVRRMTAFDASLPIAMSIGYNAEAKSLKVTLPRLPFTEYSISGVRSYAKNYVMVTGAEEGVLEKHCTNCNPTEPVTLGPKYRKNTTMLNLDSKDTGLHYSAHIYDCERMFSPVTRLNILGEIADKTNKWTWDDPTVYGLMSLREAFLYGRLNPEFGTCGYIAKIEPSIMYPTSQVVINIRTNVEETTKMLNFFPGTKINIRATVEAKAAATDISVQSWTVNANIGLNPGHINNQFQMQITRATPGQKDLKICIEGNKIYPPTEIDPLNRVIATKQETLAKLTMTMGETEEAVCVRDGMSVVITMKGQMSDEQKVAVQNEMINGKCQKDVENPIYLFAESSIVPRTPACLSEAILRTTLRKYTYTILYKNIPENIMNKIHSATDTTHAIVLPWLTYLPAHTEPGIVKGSIEFPMTNNVVNMNIRTPIHEQVLTGFPLMGSESLTPLMDNTRFSWNFLQNLKDKGIKLCVIYPEILMNTDGAVMPFKVPAQWTLLTADHSTHVFSVFVKRIEPQKLGLLMLVADHVIEIIPSVTNPKVTVDGNVIDYVDGIIVPPETKAYALRATWSHGRMIIQSSLTEFVLEWTERSVGLAMSVFLQGKTMGLCGHLDGTHANRMTNVYSLDQ